MTNLLSKILLPHRYQQLGWFSLIPFACFAYGSAFHDFELKWLDLGPISVPNAFEGTDNNLSNELSILGLFSALFLISFSKEKNEDEYIQKLRLDSILISCYLYFFLHMGGALVFYSLDYLSFLFFNLFSIPLIFILHFRWTLFGQHRTMELSL
ncbi:hypothetical protein [Algoriphagus sp.]|uniref:hypothetical protein n=1 Tax=Algoriphagus sp. TaxID=1872435 RepID=UPI00262F4F83|nr:hypothetical protein [Algoriphagus sp.]